MSYYKFQNEEKRIELLREQYPPGTKIQCIQMDDPYHAIAPGSVGTVDHVDDAGTIHMSWENGSSLGLKKYFIILLFSKRRKPGTKNESKS